MPHSNLDRQKQTCIEVPNAAAATNVFSLRYPTGKFEFDNNYHTYRKTRFQSKEVATNKNFLHIKLRVDIILYVGHLLRLKIANFHQSSPQDIEEVVITGSTIGACTYYASRQAADSAEVFTKS